MDSVGTLRVFALLAVVVPAPGQAHAGCSEPARIAQQHSHGVVRTAVVRCGSTLARARRASGTGTVVTDVTTAGTRVAWAQVRTGRNGARTTAFIVGPGPRRRSVPLRVTRSRRVRRTRLLLTTRGDLAARVADRLVLAAASGRRVVRPAGRHLQRLRLEDDRTVTWTAGGLHVFDFPVAAPPGACPTRTEFTTVTSTDRIVVSQRAYKDGDGHYGSVVRACTTATGTDRVVGTAANWLDGGDTLTVAGAYRDAVVMIRSFTNDKYDSDCEITVLVRRATDDESTALPAGTGCAAPVPRLGDPLVVTEQGVAWVSTGPEGTALRGLTKRNAIMLDPPGSSPIADLRTDGDVIRWQRDGEERTARLST